MKDNSKNNKTVFAIGLLIIMAGIVCNEWMLTKSYYCKSQFERLYPKQCTGGINDVAWSLNLSWLLIIRPNYLQGGKSWYDVDYSIAKK